MKLITIVLVWILNGLEAQFVLQSDKTCAYINKAGAVIAECVNENYAPNYNTMITEFRRMNATSYSLGFSRHYFPIIDDTSLRYMNVTMLRIDRCRVEYISDHVFDQLSYCKQLYLTYNSLKSSFLINAPELDLLSLQSNFLTNIERKMFKGLGKLRNLYLQANKISQIESDAFNDLTSLVNIILSQNLLTDLSHNLFGSLRSLETLDLSINLIERLHPDIFSNLTSLKVLDLAYNPLKSIGDGYLRFLTNVNRINIDYMEISQLSTGSFSNLSSLQILTMQGNFLTGMATGTLNDLKGLNTLSINRNLVEDICTFLHNMSNLTSVRTLYFRSNRIDKISSDCFSTLPNLVSLYMDGNLIDNIDQNGFRGLSSSLQLLSLASNKLQFIKKSYFYDLSSLVTLNLTSNQISTLEKGSFDQMHNLSTLILDHNCIFKLEPTLFNQLSALKQLSLSHNLLTKIDSSDLFGKLYQLGTLNLQDNIISYIVPSAFDNTQLVSLNLSNNELEKFELGQRDSTIQNLSISNNPRLQVLDITKLTSLRSLDLSGDRVKVVLNISSLAKVLTLEQINLSNTSASFVYAIAPYLPSSLKELNLSLVMNLDCQYLFKSLIPNTTQKNLKGVYLRGVNLNQSLSFLKSLPQLVSLDLTSNKQLNLSELGSIVGAFKSLVTLYVENIGLENMEQLNLSSSSNLKYLYCGWNRIESLKAINFKSNNLLNTLYLNNNRLKFVENGTFSQLIVLKYLDVSNNELHAIELLYNAFNWFNLQGNKITSLLVYDVSWADSVDLSNNLFTETVDLIANYVRSFSMNNNKIIRVRNDSFLSFMNLEYMSLSKNQISTIEPNSFKRQIKLKSLDLSMNSLTILNQLTLKGLSGLQVLNLSLNQIELINANVFTELISLTALYMNGNKLDMIGDSTFRPMSLLIRLKIDNNSDLIEMTNLTLQGPQQSIKLIEFDPALVKNTSNFDLLRDSFKPRMFDRQILDIQFYHAIDYVYKNQLDLTIEYSDHDCMRSLEFIRLNLQLNLYTDKLVSNFLAKCLEYFKNLIRSL